MGEEHVDEIVRSLENLSRGIEEASEVVRSSLDGLKVIHAQKGFLLCKFFIPNDVSDRDGNWHVGAIASLMDTLGVSAAYSSTGFSRLTVDLNISYYSSAKIQEEVEIEAKVVSKREKLTAVVLEVRKTEDLRLIAVGRQWVAPASSNSFPKNQPRLSKL